MGTSPDSPIDSSKERHMLVWDTKPPSPRKGRTEMRKGHNNGISNAVSLDYIRGRIEAQAEFAKAISVLSGELAERMGAVFADSATFRQPLGFSDSLPNMRETSTARIKSERSALALDAGTPDETTRNDNQRGVRQQLTKGKGKGGWRNKDGSLMTPEQRRREAKRRLSKRSDPMAKKIIAGKKKNDKQHIYAERSKAKKMGLPMPPLPDAA